MVDFAISEKELKEFGCPICGYAHGTWCFMGGGGVVVSCRNKLCRIIFYVLHDSVDEFKGISFSQLGNKVSIKPVLRPHPRKGTPAWGRREDKRPVKDGEFLANPKKSDYRHGLCFMCKTSCRLPVDVEWPMKQLFSIAVEATCGKAAERIQAIFKKERLWTTLIGDGTEYPPEFNLVSVSSCYKHRPNLIKLGERIKEKGIINDEILRKVKDLK